MLQICYNSSQVDNSRMLQKLIANNFRYCTEKNVISQLLHSLSPNKFRYYTPKQPNISDDTEIDAQDVSYSMLYNKRI